MADKDIDVNSKLVLAIADRMDASLEILRRDTMGFFEEWVVVRESFDDMTKEKIDRDLTGALGKIQEMLKAQQASTLMRKYVKTLMEQQ